MNKKYQVFISSTFSDLVEERKAVVLAAFDMGLIPSNMESFPASSLEQFSYITRMIEDCDYYILILGGRYGTLTEKGISYTEREFDYAVEREKFILVFVHSNPGSFPVSVVDESADLRAKFTEFTTKAMTNRLVRYWSTTEELVARATTSLHQAISMAPGVGWVRSTSAVDEATKQRFLDARAEMAHMQEAFRREIEAARQQAEQAKSENWRLGIDLERAVKLSSNVQSLLINLFREATVAATSAEINAWVEGAREQYSEEFINRISTRMARYAVKDFVMPALYGSEAVTVIVKAGVRVNSDLGIGHSRILYMDGFRAEGL